LHPNIEAPARDVIDSHPDYLALHLRYTDRSLTAPTDQQIETGLDRLKQATGVSSLFVASDVPARRDQWIAWATAMGFAPWTIEHEPIERSDPRSAYPALIDWRVLGSARAMVYFAESSFAEEAVVAAGTYDVSIGLSASGARLRARGVSQLLSTGMSWPKRHFGKNARE
jgi:hypothetical protein